jgi:hypothetical protein
MNKVEFIIPSLAISFSVTIWERSHKRLAMSSEFPEERILSNIRNAFGVKKKFVIASKLVAAVMFVKHQRISY